MIDDPEVASIRDFASLLPPTQKPLHLIDRENRQSPAGPIRQVDKGIDVGYGARSIGAEEKPRHEGRFLDDQVGSRVHVATAIRCADTRLLALSDVLPLMPSVWLVCRS